MNVTALHRVYTGCAFCRIALRRVWCYHSVTEHNIKPSGIYLEKAKHFTLYLVLVIEGVSQCTCIDNNRNIENPNYQCC